MSSQLLGWLLSHPEDRFVAERQEALEEEIALAKEMLAFYYGPQLAVTK